MKITEQTKQNWSWAGRYLALIAVSLILAAILGNMDLFETTFVVQGKLSAAHLVRFLSYSAALAAFWMLGRRSTMVLQQTAGAWSFLQHLILPVFTLVVVSMANEVLLLILKTLMNASMHNIYNWVFIVAILASAGWVLMAVLGQSAPLTQAFTETADKLDRRAKTKKCEACGVKNEAGAKFCKDCGKKLPTA